MTYTDVISLADAKAYLRVDHTDSDAEITRMIKSSLSLIEKWTNIIICTRDITYYYQDGCIRVYDGPINSVVSAASTTRDTTVKNLYTVYTETNTATETIILNVGYNNPGNVPPELIEAALELIDFWYYKNDGKANITLIPESVRAVLDMNKRFII